MDLKKFLPAHLGGYERNVYNVLIGWFFLARNRKSLVYNALLGRFPDTKNREPLWNFIRKAKPERILEIGLGGGWNAKKMMELTDDCEYFCFDTFERKESREAYGDLRNRDNVLFFIGDTKKILPKHIKDLPKMDLVFIDGGHDYETVKNDWVHCKRLMHEGTACFFHDYHMSDVRRVVNEIDEDRYHKRIIKPSEPPDFALVTRRSSS